MVAQASSVSNSSEEEDNSPVILASGADSKSLSFTCSDFNAILTDLPSRQPSRSSAPKRQRTGRKLYPRFVLFPFVSLTVFLLGGVKPTGSKMVCPEDLVEDDRKSFLFYFPDHFSSTHSGASFLYLWPQRISTRLGPGDRGRHIQAHSDQPCAQEDEALRGQDHRPRPQVFEGP